MMVGRPAVPVGIGILLGTTALVLAGESFAWATEPHTSTATSATRRLSRRVVRRLSPVVTPRPDPTPAPSPASDPTPTPRPLPQRTQSAEPQIAQRTTERPQSTTTTEPQITQRINTTENNTSQSAQSTTQAPTPQPLRTIEGEVERWVEDAPDGARVTYRLRSPQTLESWELQFATPPTTPLSPGDRLSVKGIEQRDPRRLLVADYTVVPTARLQRKSTIPTRSGALGALRTAVILVNFLDRKVQPYSPAQIHELVFNPITGVSGFFFTSSYKKVWLEGSRTSPKGSVVGWHTLPFSAGGSTCPAQRMSDEALKAANRDLDYEQYTHVIIMFPRLGGCRIEGSSGIGGRFSTILVQLQHEDVIGEHPGMAEQQTKDTTIHELGHTLRLSHSNQWRCPAGIVVRSSMFAACEEREYGDRYSPMTGGYSPRPDFNAVQKYQLGWLAPENTLSLEAPGTYTHTIVPLENPSKGIQALRVLKERLYLSSESTPRNLWYYLEYRQPIGVDQPFQDQLPASTFNGALVHVNYTTTKLYPTSEGSVLLDMSPAGLLNDDDAALQVGQTFTDPSGMTITVLSATTQGLQVQVTIPRDTADKVAPQAKQANQDREIIVGADWLSQPRRVVPVEIEAADNRGIVTVNFYDNGTLIGTDTDPPFAIEWDASAVVNRATRRFEIRLRDAAGNEGVAHMTVTLIVDRIPPTAEVVSPLPGAVVKGGVEVVIQAGDETRGKFVELVVDDRGIQIQRLEGNPPPYRFLWDTTQWSEGSHTVQARAEDKAGNIQVSQPVHVTVRNGLPPDLTPPTPPMFLTPLRQGGRLVLPWSGEGILQRANAITGPWEPVPDAKSPYAVSVTEAAMKFFQLAAPSPPVRKSTAPSNVRVLRSRRSLSRR